MPIAIAPSDTAARLAAVSADVARACRDAKRDVASVTLIAVSKTFSADAIEPVIEVGHRAFGENRVQEAKGKWPQLLAKFSDGLPSPERGKAGEGVVTTDLRPIAPRSTSPFQGEVKEKRIELHLIGPLQSNKVRDAVALFDAIHSVDRDSLCEALAKELAGQRRSPLLFLEINTGGEAQKAGVLPQDADAFLARCREKFGLKISGLMCIPPLSEAPGPHFALTAKLAARNGLKLLSMGMSADFVAAIQLGATHVRVGSAIFGERAKNA